MSITILRQKMFTLLAGVRWVIFLSSGRVKFAVQPDPGGPCKKNPSRQASLSSIKANNTQPITAQCQGYSTPSCAHFHRSQADSTMFGSRT